MNEYDERWGLIKEHTETPDPATDALMLARHLNLSIEDLRPLARECDVDRLNTCPCCGIIYLRHFQDGRMIKNPFCSVVCWATDSYRRRHKEAPSRLAVSLHDGTR